MEQTNASNTRKCFHTVGKDARNRRIALADAIADDFRCMGEIIDRAITELRRQQTLTPDEAEAKISLNRAYGEALDLARKYANAGQKVKTVLDVDCALMQIEASKLDQMHVWEVKHAMDSAVRILGRAGVETVTQQDGGAERIIYCVDEYTHKGPFRNLLALKYTLASAYSVGPAVCPFSVDYQNVKLIRRGLMDAHLNMLGMSPADNEMSETEYARCLSALAVAVSGADHLCALAENARSSRNPESTWSASSAEPSAAADKIAIIAAMHLCPLDIC